MQTLTIDNGKFGRIFVEADEDSVQVTFGVTNPDGRGGITTNYVLLTGDDIRAVIEALQNSLEVK